MKKHPELMQIILDMHRAQGLPQEPATILRDMAANKPEESDGGS